jgi:hypothetical protein
MAGMTEWTEVNIVPSGHPEQLLVDLIDPLIHQELNDDWDNWHYFWETEPIKQLHLRLRIRWLDPSQTAGDAKFSAFLTDEESKSNIASWFPGSHGVRNQVYPGEGNDYGPEVWEPTYKNWTSGSELALAIIKSYSQNHLTQKRGFHWERRTHLFTNELLLPESLLCLRQASRYRSPQDIANPQIAAILQEIDRLNIQL